MRVQYMEVLNITRYNTLLKYNIHISSLNQLFSFYCTPLRRVVGGRLFHASISEREIPPGVHICLWVFQWLTSPLIHVAL